MMAELSITITQVTEQDYDGVDETTKHLTAEIDCCGLKETWITETTTSDADAKTAFKAHLTAMGWTWDTEA
jgi:hypothetical protein